jgi:hypothetical protein
VGTGKREERHEMNVMEIGFEHIPHPGSSFLQQPDFPIVGRQMDPNSVCEYSIADNRN